MSSYENYYQTSEVYDKTRSSEGVEIILNMREKMDRMQNEVNEFMAYVKQELTRGLGDWEKRLGTALVRSHPSDLVRASDVTSSTSHSASEVLNSKRR